MAKNKSEIVITALTEQAQIALKRLQMRMKGLSEYSEHLNARFEGVSQAAEGFKGKLERLGIASVFAEGGLFGLVNKVADVGFELKESAEKTGMSTKQLQYWQYAAKQSNLDSGTLTNAVTRLNVSMGMAHKATSQQAMAFRFLHVSLKDAHGQFKSTNEVFKETVTALANVKDRGMQGVASMVLLSKSGRQLLPFMKKVAEHSDELSTGFQKYGYVLTDQAIKASEKFHESSTNLKISMESLGMSIGSKLMPVLQPLIDSTLDYVTSNRKVLTSNISATILEIAKGFRDAWRDLSPFLKGTWALIKAMGGFKTVIIAITSVYMVSLLISFAQLVKAVWLLNAAFLANPFGLVIVALGLIGFALYKLFKLLFPNSKAWEDFWNKIKNVAKEAKDFILKIFDELKPSNLFKELGSMLAKIPSNFTASMAQTSGMPTSFGAISAPMMMGAAMSPAMSQGGQQGAQNLNVHMKIDHEGKPQITKVQSSAPVNFTTNVGRTR